MNKIHHVPSESLAVCKVWLFRSAFRTSCKYTIARRSLGKRRLGASVILQIAISNLGSSDELLSSLARLNLGNYILSISGDPISVGESSMW